MILSFLFFVLFVINGQISKYLPPQEDVIKVEVLKDNSSTAIYGKDGQDGVIWITTKSYDPYIKVKIVDESNEPIIGATVVQQGTCNGDVSDLDGNAYIYTKRNKTDYIILHISSIGYKSRTIKVPINIQSILIKLEVEDIIDVCSTNFILVNYEKE